MYLRPEPDLALEYAIYSFHSKNILNMLLNIVWSSKSRIMVKTNRDLHFREQKVKKIGSHTISDKIIK